MRYVHMHVNIKINYNEKINKSVVNVVFLMFLAKAGEREGGRGGQNTWGPDWSGGLEILIKHLVMGATVKRVGGP